MGSEKKITLVSLALPIFFEAILFIMLGFVDIIILSRISDQAAGAVGATNQIMSFFNIVFAIISSGTAVLISQFIGAKESKEAQKTVIVSLSVILLVGALCSFVLVVWNEAILDLIGVTEGLMPFGRTYLGIVGGFLFAQGVLNICTVSMRSYGHAKQTLVITASMNVLNIIGDLVLGFGLLGLPALGVKGVAIATSFSRVVATIAALIYVFKNLVPPSAVLYLRKFPHRILSKLLKVGIPSAMENMSYNVSQLVVTSIILYNLGETMYITRTYVWTMLSISFIFSISIGMANQMLVGRLVGEEKFDEAFHECMKNFRLSFFFSLLVGAVFYFLGHQLIGIFTDDPAIIAWGGAVAMINAFLEPGRTFNIVIINGLRGAGDVVFPVVIAIIFMWLLAVGAGYFFGVILGWGLPGIWVGLLLDEWVRGLIMYGRWQSRKWRTKSLVQR